VLAGTAVAGGAIPSIPLVQTMVAASLFYTGGMFLNDAFDAAIDGQSRPERPIPAGDVSRTEAFAVGGGCLAGGAALLAGDSDTLMLGLLLAGAIVLYDSWHKLNPVAPLVMGACRGLVYLIAAAAVGSPSSVALAGAAIITAYVIGLTVVAKLSGPAARWRVPLLLAGISLVDAAVIGGTTGSVPLVAAAAAGFPLTLSLQRWVPGD
jgi:4-hydroxybenzoate polyprenyltransferase